jgi:hypothetical protein
MPGQRHSAAPRTRGSWLPRLAGLGVVVVVAAGAVTGYLIAFHPGTKPRAPVLPTRVVSYQTVGLVATYTQPGSSTTLLLQLLDQHGTPIFSPLGQSQLSQRAPQWTADLMGGGSYIFIYLPTGQCLSASGPLRQPKLALRHCDLDVSQRWRRTKGPVASQAHDFYQYANLGDRSCLTQQGELPGPLFGATLAECSPSAPASQLLAFW